MKQITQFLLEDENPTLKNGWNGQHMAGAIWMKNQLNNTCLPTNNY